MPNVTVQNLLGSKIVVPGGYYVDTISAYGSATFDVPDSDEFLGDSRVSDMVTAGSIRVVLTAADALTRPLPQYSTATMPAATTVAAGTQLWNTTLRSVMVSDGTTWSESITGGATLLSTGATAVAANRFVGLNASEEVEVSPTAGERPLGVTTEAIAATSSGRIQKDGAAEIMAGAAILASDELVPVIGGYAAPYLSSAISLGTAVIGADTDDDLVQGNLPDTVQAVCAGVETGNMIIYGKVGAAYTKETVSLVGGAGTYVSTNTWAAVYCIEFDTASVGTIDVQTTGPAAAAIIPTQIAALAAARKYGAIVPDVATDPRGHRVSVQAGGANATECVIFGTDYAGAEQAEIVTMNGTTPVFSTLAYRSFSHMFIGADGIVFNAGVTSQYTMDSEYDEQNAVRAYALEAEAVAGATVRAMVLDQNAGEFAATYPLPFHASAVAYGGGGTSTTATVLGVAATDVILATLNASTNPVYIESAIRTGVNTVTLTFSADPGASTVVGLLIYRP